jgi:hypothetical protein
MGLALLAAPAGSQTCQTPIALTSGVSVQANAGPPVVYSVTPDAKRWSAIAARPNDAEVWAVEARDEPVAYPTCFAPILAGSYVPNLNFLVTDWHNRPGGTDYVAVGTGGGGSPVSARVEYEQASGIAQTNRPFDLIPTGPNDFLTVYDYNMFATIPYRIRIVPSAGLTALRVFVFAPRAPDNGWATRADRQVELALTPGVENVLTFTPTVDGNHAIVILDENGAAGSYYFAVGQCPFSNSVLVDNAPFLIPSLDDWPTFQQTTSSWGVVGVRGEPGYTYALDLATARNQYGPYPVCASSILASQVSGSGVRLVTGDFRSAAPGYYPAHVNLDGQPQTSSEGYVEWEGAADMIVVNGPPLAVSPPAHNVLDGWSLNLTAGTTYGLQITPDAGSTASYQLLLFRNPSPGSACWATRPDAVFQTASAGGYTSPASDLYGLVVVNDNGGTGGYSISVHSGTVGVEPPVVTRSLIRWAAPNPLSGSTRIACQLAHAGRAAVDVLDAAGRGVATMELGVRPAGPMEALWNRRDDAGRSVPAGFYFAVLRLDGVSVDRCKLTVLATGAAR